MKKEKFDIYIEGIINEDASRDTIADILQHHVEEEKILDITEDIAKHIELRGSFIFNMIQR